MQIMQIRLRFIYFASGLCTQKCKLNRWSSKFNYFAKETNFVKLFTPNSKGIKLSS